MSQVQLKNSFSVTTSPQMERARDYRKRCGQMAVQAIAHGILSRDMPVLDVGCRNPYSGMYAALRMHVNWDGEYTGVDSPVDPNAKRSWTHRREVGETESVNLVERSFQLDEEQARLPFPPTKNNPVKPFGCAFAVNTLGDVRQQDRLVSDLKRVSAMVVVCGGVTEQDLERWGFLTTGWINVDDGTTEFWGIWMDERAKRRYTLRNTLPQTTMGFFAVRRSGDSNGFLPVRLGHRSDWWPANC